MLIVAKTNRTITECEVYSGDGHSGSFHDCEWRHSGTISNVKSTGTHQFNLFGIGNYLKLVFTKEGERDTKNPGGLVGLGVVKVYGQPMAYYKGIVNHETPLVKSGINDEVDRVMIEMGVPLQQPGLDWNFD